MREKIKHYGGYIVALPREKGRRMMRGEGAQYPWNNYSYARTWREA